MDLLRRFEEGVRAVAETFGGSTSVDVQSNSR